MLTLVGATTENPYFAVNAPLLSRSSLFRLRSLDTEALTILLVRAAKGEVVDSDADAGLYWLARMLAAGEDARFVARRLVILAQAVVHLATAPKSNRVTVALSRAQADVAARPAGDVPVHLRDGHYQGAKALGHGEGYDYPHDHETGWVDQEYRPSEVAAQAYYEPTDHGYEEEIAQRMAQRTSGSNPRP